MYNKEEDKLNLFVKNEEELEVIDSYFTRLDKDVLEELSNGKGDDEDE
jgi:hypothetical protein